MAADKTGVKEAISAIRGMSAMFRSFASAEAALAALMGLESTRESIEAGIKSSQKELDEVLASKRNAKDVVDIQNAEIESLKKQKEREVDASLDKYADEAHRKFAAKEREFDNQILALVDKKDVLESQVASLGDVLKSLNEAQEELVNVIAERKVEEQRLANIKNDIISLKNRL